MQARVDKEVANYRAMKFTNPYEGMENVFEDLRVSTQAADFQAEQGAQQRANILGQLRGAAGGSGIAGLAQSMANQGQLASQQASESIGQQESRNQMAAAQQAANIQMQERVGDARSQDLEAQKTATLLGMSQQRVAAANQARAQAKAAQMSAIGDIGEVGMQMMKGGDDGENEGKDKKMYSDNPNYDPNKVNKDVSFGGKTYSIGESKKKK